MYSMVFGKIFGGEKNLLLFRKNIENAQRGIDLMEVPGESDDTMNGVLNTVFLKRLLNFLKRSQLIDS
jgi:hypothetical protein